MKNNFLIGIGIGLVLISGLYFICKKFRKKEKKEKKLHIINPAMNIVSANDIKRELDKKKLYTVKEIKDRHEEAKKIMTETLENIKSEKNDSESKNTEILDKMDDQLNELMK